MRITKALIKAYSQMGQKGAASGIGMLEVAKLHPNVRAVVADSVAIASLDRFLNLYPDKVINVGIAEQNLVSVSAGYASESDAPVFAFTYSAFLIGRAYEQVRINLSYLQNNVKLVGNSAGFAMEMLGVSHWAINDLAVIRSLPNISILSASDCLSAIKLIILAGETDGPVYLRLCGNRNIPIVYQEDADFNMGGSNVVRDGDDVLILATGLMVQESMKAAQILEEKYNVRCKVVDVYSIKPFDYSLLETTSERTRLVVTVEEHTLVGGLGSIVNDYKIEKGFNIPVLNIGVGDYFGKLGTQEYIWEQYGLTDKQIAENINNKLKN